MRRGDGEEPVLADVPEQLQTLFLPQVEQLRMREERATFGGLAVLPEDAGTGYLWVAALGEHCLLSAHDFTLRTDIPLTEYPTDSYALSLMSKSMTALAPVPAIPKPAEDNVLAFRQRPETTSFTLPAHVRCRSTTLCFMPEYFEQAANLTGMDPDALKSALASATPNALPPAVRACLKTLAPRKAGSDAEGLRYAAKALEALSYLTNAPSSVCPPEATEAQRQLVAQAVSFMEAHLSEKITLKRLEAELFASRSRICAAFRAVQNEGAMECLTRLRMQHAEELLAGDGLSVSEAAQAVGFAHQSSFCDAFKRHTGLSPTAWRRSAP